MNSLPIIALDVDGVLSPVTLRSTAPEAPHLVWPLEEFVQAKSAGSFGIFAARPVLDFFKGIHNKRAIVKWHTSWRENAQANLAPDFDLPAWDLFSGRSAWLNSQGWWKFDDVLTAVNNGERVIWIDDDIADSEEITDSFRQNSNVHMISPGCRSGLTPTHLEEITIQLKNWGF
jgi:hypothetical protein